MVCCKECADDSECVWRPAPKEEEMNTESECCPICFYDECQCEDGLSIREKEKRTIELRTVWDRAYFAALTGNCYGLVSSESIVELSKEVANATVAAWPAMTAERDALIAKAVQG